MQSALLRFVDTVRIVHAPPDPAWAVHKRTIISHTRRRVEDHVRGAISEKDALFQARGTSRLDEIEAALLKFVNGDPRGPLVHHETGCCSSIEETKDGIFAAILGAGMLLGGDTDLPTKNRWGSSTQALAKVVFSQMFHSLLSKVVHLAFPRHESGAPPPGAADDGDREDWRAMCRSKVWRMKKVLSHPGMEWSWALMSFITGPVDHLWARLQWLDKRGNALVTCTGRSSPIAECQSELMSMLAVPVSHGWLASVFWRYGGDGHEALVDEARRKLLCLKGP